MSGVISLWLTLVMQDFLFIACFITNANSNTPAIIFWVELCTFKRGFPGKKMKGFVIFT